MKKATLLLGGRVAFGKLADDIPELSAIIEILYGGEENVNVFSKEKCIAWAICAIILISQKKGGTNYER